MTAGRAVPSGARVPIVARADEEPVRPCANCGLPVRAVRSVVCYCAPLCGVAARVVRGYRRLAERSQLDDHAAAWAVDLALRALTDDPYEPGDNGVAVAARGLVWERTGGGCGRCGRRPALRVGPLAALDERDPVEGLSLRCDDCYRHDAQIWIEVQRDQLPAAFVRARLVERAARHHPRQPSDATRWTAAAWRRGAKQPDAEARRRWDQWRSERGPGPARLAEAIVGFPASLDAWAWYAP